MGGKIKPAVQQLSLAAQIGPGSKKQNEINMLFCSL